jgi:hypothetical protein
MGCNGATCIGGPAYGHNYAYCQEHNVERKILGTSADECSSEGTYCNGNNAVTCYFDSNYYSQRWKTTTQNCPCGCSNGNCLNDECTSGDKRCLSTTTLQTCGNYDSDSCTEWGGDTSCPGGSECQYGSCCKKDGVFCSKPGTSSQECCGGMCSPYSVCESACTNECSPTEKRCKTNTTWEVCGNFDSDSCTEWGGEVICGENQHCDNGNCVSDTSCQPNDHYSCYDNDVYWFDSCNNMGSKKEECDFGCENNECKKTIVIVYDPLYNSVIKAENTSSLFQYPEGTVVLKADLKKGEIGPDYDTWGATIDNNLVIKVKDTLGNPIMGAEIYREFLDPPPSWKCDDIFDVSRPDYFDYDPIKSFVQSISTHVGIDMLVEEGVISTAAADGAYRILVAYEIISPALIRWCECNKILNRIYVGTTDNSGIARAGRVIPSSHEGGENYYAVINHIPARSLYVNYNQNYAEIIITKGFVPPLVTISTFSNNINLSDLYFNSQSHESRLYLNVPKNAMVTEAKMSIQGHNPVFPVNVTLDVGGDGDNEWAFYGEFNLTQETQDVSREINKQLDKCTSDECQIPLVFKSASEGHVIVSNPEVYYVGQKYTDPSCILSQCPPPSDWWNTAWAYRTSLNVSNGGYVLSNYPIKINFDAYSLYQNGKMKQDCSDIRFTDTNGVKLNYFISKCDVNGSSDVFVKIDTIPSSSSHDIFMYYGNPDALDESIEKLVCPAGYSAKDDWCLQYRETMENTSSEWVLEGLGCSGVYVNRYQPGRWPPPYEGSYYHAMCSWCANPGEFPRTFPMTIKQMNQDLSGAGVQIRYMIANDYYCTYPACGNEQRGSGPLQFSINDNILDSLTIDHTFPYTEREFTSAQDFGNAATLKFYIGSGDVGVGIDDIRIRKYTPNEPVVTFGQELMIVRVPTDNDGDGYDSTVDCNDLNPNVNPGTTEICNGIDDNCNNFIDEDLGTVTCGMGACNHTIQKCSNGAIQACDPYWNMSNEVCDGVDNDCDGSVDEINCGSGKCFELFHPDPAIGNFANEGYGPQCADSRQWREFDVDADGFIERYMLMGEKYKIWVKCMMDTRYNGYPTVYNFGNHMCDGVGAGGGCQAGWTGCYDGNCNYYYEEALIQMPYEYTSPTISYPEIYCYTILPDLTLKASDGWKSGTLKLCYDANKNVVDCGSTSVVRTESYMVLKCGVDADCNGSSYCYKPSLDTPMTYFCKPKCGNGICDLGEICTKDSQGNETCDGIDNDCDGLVDEGLNCVACTDNDKDGYNSTGGACGPIDCNDNNASIHPNASELCDSIDNDCDHQIDEVFTNKGQSCTVGVGECLSAGIFICNSYGTGLDCNAQIKSPITEVCDNKDNDCNGLVDEELGTATCGLGICQHTVDNCINGVTQTCNPYEGATSETCNGLDDNCDGIVDNSGNALCDDGLYCNGAETCGGANGCLAGTAVNCADNLFCTVNERCDESADSCVYDNKDCSANNVIGIAICNNNPDNNPLTWDYRSAFTSVCDEANDVCTAGNSTITNACDVTKCGAACDATHSCAATECDNLDGCYTGTYRDYTDVSNTCNSDCACTSNSCSSYSGIVTDNDKDGYDIQCDHDCNDNDNSTYPNATEICDNKDNDCDGLVDEDLGNITCGLGVCNHTIQACVNGIPQTCNPYQGSTIETCDNKDNDCDGLTDENLTRTCSSNIGICTIGTERCSAGSWVGCTGRLPQKELYNNLDDDCDGTVDDGINKCQSSPCIIPSSLIKSRDNLLIPEPNSPNTIDSCTDGTYGTYQADESIENITVTSLNGSSFKTGDTVRVDITTYCWGIQDNLNFVYSNASKTVGASAPLPWRVVNIQYCNGSRFFKTFSATFILDNKIGEHAIRGSFQYLGNINKTCGIGGYDDNDDVIINVTESAIVDLDGDGYDSSIDCNDNNPNIHPGATEICNGVDDNCNGQIDEGNVCSIPYYCDSDHDGYFSKLPSGTCNIFNCTLVGCINTPGTDCDDNNSSVHPSATEICNGKDDNCDGAVDENLGTTICGLGICNHTIQNCVNGVQQTCDPYQGVSNETCDGLDNNCNGQIDENLGTTTCGLGICNHTIQNCINGTQQTCNPYQGTTTEVCDNKDNDCDGMTDETLGNTTCGFGVCSHTVQNCVNGITQTCNPYEYKTNETCDNRDNDCDGLIDEDLGSTTCGLGVCSHTTQNCINGTQQTCNPYQGSTTEICDNKDNDCDGQVDEGLGSATCGLGICNHTIQNCINGATQTCNPYQGAINETCDGIDNDCDGLVDEGLNCNPIGWLNEAWKYRIAINLSNSSMNLSNYPVKISADTTSLYNQGKLQSNCGDIRFTNSAGDLLNYYVVSCITNNTSKNSTIYVRIDKIPNTINTIIYMYYGNPTINSSSNLYATCPAGYSSKDDWCLEYKENMEDNRTGWVFEGYGCSGVYVNYYSPGRWPAPYEGSYYHALCPYCGYKNNVAVLKQSGQNFSGAGVQGKYMISNRYYISGRGTGPLTLKFDNKVLDSVSISSKFGYTERTFSSSTDSGSNVTVSFYMSSGDMGIGIDDIRIRKYANPEPTYTMGQETQKTNQWNLQAAITEERGYGIPSSNADLFIFGQTVQVGNIINRTLSGTINDPNVTTHWQAPYWPWYPPEGLYQPDGYFIRTETLVPDQTYRLIIYGAHAGAHPGVVGYVNIIDPFYISTIESNALENPSTNNSAQITNNSINFNIYAACTSCGACDGGGINVTVVISKKNIPGS